MVVGGIEDLPNADYWRRGANAWITEAAPIASFLGGMASGWLSNWNWNYPLVTLDIYPAGLELRPSQPWLKFWVPYWTQPYPMIAGAEVLGRTKLTSGVRFRMTDGDYRIFWCHYPSRVADVLEPLGVNVDRMRRRYSSLFPRF
jgi:hypothetical protein